MKTKLKNPLFSVLNNFACVLSGALLPFAFSPYDYYLLAILSGSLLFVLLQHQSPKNAFLKGLLFGAGCFGIGVNWVYISIHNFGNSNLFLGIGITLLFILILALFPALAAYSLQKFFPDFSGSPFTRTQKALLIFPSVFALTDWIRSWIFSGFPWLLWGHSQTLSPLAGYAPLIGLYGVSFLVLVSSGAVSLFFIQLRQKKYYNSLAVLIGLVLLWSCGKLLCEKQWTHPLSNTPSVQVSLIQGNIPITLKWSQNYALKSFDEYVNLSRALINTPTGQNNQLIIWPETAVTFFLSEAGPLLAPLDNFAKENHAGILTGIPVIQDHHYYNAAVMLGQGSGVYLKRHLVPFGEYTPFQQWLGKLLDFLHLPMSDFSEGPTHQALLDFGHLKVAVLICYEVAYPNLLRSDLIDTQANLFTVLSNDSWFGHSIALAQQRQISQFAALLTGRYLLVATNSGETLIIDPKGHVIAHSPIDKTTVLENNVQAYTGKTPWVRLGDTPFILFFIGLLLWFKLRARLFKP